MQDGPRYPTQLVLSLSLFQGEESRKQTRGHIFHAGLQEVLVGRGHKQSPGLRIGLAMRGLPQASVHPQLPPLNLLDLHCRKQQPPWRSLDFLQA